MNRLPSPLPEISVPPAATGPLPEGERIELLLRTLQATLRGLPVAALRRKRARLFEHFAHCGGSYDVSCAVLALVDLHLARREPARDQDRRQGIRSRKR